MDYDYGVVVTSTAIIIWANAVLENNEGLMNIIGQLFPAAFK